MFFPFEESCSIETFKVRLRRVFRYIVVISMNGNIGVRFRIFEKIPDELVLSIIESEMSQLICESFLLFLFLIYIFLEFFKRLVSFVRYIDEKIGEITVILLTI